MVEPRKSDSNGDNHAVRSWHITKGVIRTPEWPWDSDRPDHASLSFGKDPVVDMINETNEVISDSKSSHSAARGGRFRETK